MHTINALKFAKDATGSWPKKSSQEKTKNLRKRKEARKMRAIWSRAEKEGKNGHTPSGKGKKNEEKPHENFLFGLRESALFTTHTHCDNFTNTTRSSSYRYALPTGIQFRKQKTELQFQNTPNAKPANGILSGTFEILYPRSGRRNATETEHSPYQPKFKKKKKEGKRERRHERARKRGGAQYCRLLANAILRGERMGQKKPQIR